jgi:hypothetical protein
MELLRTWRLVTVQCIMIPLVALPPFVHAYHGVIPLQFFRFDASPSRLVRTTLSCAAIVGLCGSVSAQTPAAQAPATPRPAEPKSTVEITFDFTDPGSGDSNQYETDIRFTQQVTRRSTLFLEVDQHARFDDPDFVVLFGAGHGFGRRRPFVMSGSVALGPDSDYVPKQTYDVKGLWHATRHMGPVFEYEHSTYTSPVDVDELTVGVKLTPDQRTSLQLVYIVTEATLSKKVNENGHAFGLEASVSANRRIAFTLKGGYGHEHAMARNRTIREVLRSIKQLTIEPGINWQMTRERGLKISYAYEDKKGRPAQHGLILDGYVTF